MDNCFRHATSVLIVLAQLALGGCDGDRDSSRSNPVAENSAPPTTAASTTAPALGSLDGSASTPSSDANGPEPETGLQPDARATTEVDNEIEPKTAKQEIGNRVFDDTEVKSYFLTFSDEEYARLMDLSTLVSPTLEVNTDRYVEASLRVGDRELPSIGVRFKGDYSLWGCVDPRTGERAVRVESLFGNIDVCQRFSLKLDFDRHDAAARVDGLKKLNLHAMSADPSKLRERLGYSLFREMGIAAPRMAHARVYINGEYHGLFAAVEQVDGRFTANRYPASGDGNLYKQIWPAEHISDEDAAEHLETNDDSGVIDTSDFIAFKDAVTAAAEAGSAEPLAAYVDFDTLARYIVVDRAINNYDGILLFWPQQGHDYNHNFYWYHDGESGRFVLIPWDLDKTFWYPEPLFWTGNAPYEQYDVPNWNVISSSCDLHTTTFDALGFQWQIRPLDCDPFLRLLRDEIYDRQQAIAEQFISGPYSAQTVGAKVAAWRSQIAEAIEEDPLVDSAQWVGAVDALLADLPNFHENLRLMMSGIIEE